MKKIIGLSCFSAMSLYLVMLGGSNIACNKPTDCKVIINVVDTPKSAAVQGATVLLYSSSPPGQVSYTATTDGSGNASFDCKLPAIFNIKVSDTMTVPVHKIMTGAGIVQLQIGQTVNQTVTIQ